MSENNKKAKAFNFNRSFKTDKAKEQQGAWDEIYIDGQSLEVLVARSGNPSYKKMLRSEMQRNKRKLDREDQAALDLFDRIMIKVTAATILLGWKELEVDGELLEYSVDNAEMVLAHEDFRKEIQSISESFELYKNTEDEEIKGN